MDREIARAAPAAGVTLAARHRQALRGRGAVDSGEAAVPVRLFARPRFQDHHALSLCVVLATIGLSLVVAIGLALLVTVPLEVIFRLLVPARATRAT